MEQDHDEEEQVQQKLQSRLDELISKGFTKRNPALNELTAVANNSITDIV